MKKIVFVVFLLFAITTVRSQLGFCNGSKGDPIFTENFGTGTNYGPALPVGTTSYTFMAGTPNDGQYTIHNFTNQYTSWHNASDHTPNDIDGKSLIVNASYTAGEFYKRIVTGLCVNTTFEFTAYLLNVSNANSTACNGNSIPINVTFEIWDVTDTVLLTSGSTNNIFASASVVWTQYGLTFTTLPGQTEVILKMKNNSAGGCGNDLAIDDIMFRSCGDSASISSSLNSGDNYETCIDNVPPAIPLAINITNATPHVFQWQSSTDLTTWTDIPGANATTYNAINLTQNTYFRVKIAQDAANLSNPFCYTVSQQYFIKIIPKPNQPTSGGDRIICDNETIPTLTVTTDPGNAIDWYDAPVGGNLLLSNSTSYTPTAAGNYYTQAYVPGKDCASDTRTVLNLTINNAPKIDDQTILICEKETVILDAGNPGAAYLWQPGGAITQTIVVSGPGIYTATATFANSCSDIGIFTVNQVVNPVIANITVDDTMITIQTATSGDYEYSLDGINYQNSNIFENLTGGIHTVYARGKFDCGVVTAEVFILAVPKYFTPNGDGFNDLLEVPELSVLQNGRMVIFDRYGKLLKTVSGAKPQWDGTFNNKKLPASDYWYKVTSDNGQTYHGHFTLKR